MTDQQDKPSLLLKCGSIIGWNGAHEGTAFRAALDRLLGHGISASSAPQFNTDDQKQAICDAIDAVFEAGGEVSHDWIGETYDTADAAKKYVMEYGARND